MWRVFRLGSARAQAIAQQAGAPYVALASLAKLDPTDTHLWLHEYKVNTLVRRGDRFTVPNTVIVSIGELNFLARGSVVSNATSVKVKLEAKGFKVVWLDYNVRRWVVQDVTHHYEDLWAFVFYGHGHGKGGKVWPGALGGTISIDSKGSELFAASAFRPRQLALLVLKACGADADADAGNWREKMSRWGEIYLGSGYEFSAATWGILATVDRAIQGMPDKAWMEAMYAEALHDLPLHMQPHPMVY